MCVVKLDVTESKILTAQASRWISLEVAELAQLAWQCIQAVPEG